MWAKISLLTEEHTCMITFHTKTLVMHRYVACSETNWCFKFSSNSCLNKNTIDAQNHEGELRERENNKKESTFKGRKSKHFHLHNLHACIYNTNTYTSHHCCITSISASFPVFLAFYIPALFSSTFFLCLRLSLHTPYLCKLSFSHHNSASVPSCCQLFAWNVICGCNRGRNWV